PFCTRVGRRNGGGARVLRRFADGDAFPLSSAFPKCPPSPVGGCSFSRTAPINDSSMFLALQPMLNMNNFIKILAIIAGVFWGRHSPPFKNGNHSEPAKSVIVYDLHECGKSVRLMRELDAAGIPYEVRDLGNPL